MNSSQKTAYWQTEYAIFKKELTALKAINIICPSLETSKRIESLESEIANCQENLAELGVISVQLPDEIASTTYMAARNAAIQQVDIAFYGENFPERLRNLWARLKSEPEIVADEVNDWLGSWHPEAMQISHEAMLLVRKKSK